MQRHILALVAVIAIAEICHAQALQPADRAALSDSARFRMMMATASLPREVSQFCADPNGRLAAPGENWNATDVMTTGLATRRLIWVSRSDKFFVAHYEQGGFAHTAHVVIGRVGSDGSTYDLVWRAYAPRLRDHQDFIHALNADALQPESPFR